MSDIIQCFGLLHHSYAYDTQLYITIEKWDYFTNKLSDIESCVSEIELCMERNMLKLNDDKTECIVLKSKHNTISFAGANVHVGGTVMGVSSRITFNQTLSMPWAMYKGVRECLVLSTFNWTKNGCVTFQVRPPNGINSVSWVK